MEFVWNTAYCPAEYVAFHKPNCLKQVGLGRCPVFVVVVELQEERIGHVNLQLPDVVECRFQVRIGF